jgi:CheY-like chemotaxis protein
VQACRNAPSAADSWRAVPTDLHPLREEGKIRNVALSNVTQEHIERARKIVPIVSVQNRYSFADREWDYGMDDYLTKPIRPNELDAILQKYSPADAAPASLLAGAGI